MLTIRDWRDLSQFGVQYLTGEACAIGLRVLCDLNQDGAALVRECLSLPPDCAMAANYNSAVNGQPAVASILLPRAMSVPLAVVALFRDGAESVLALDDGKVVGFYPEGHARHTYEEEYEASGEPPQGRWYVPLQNQPRVGLSCIHAATGRHA